MDCGRSADSRSHHNQQPGDSSCKRRRPRGDRPRGLQGQRVLRISASRVSRLAGAFSLPLSPIGREKGEGQLCLCFRCRHQPDNPICQVLITMVSDEMPESPKQFGQRQRLGENDSSVRPALPLPSMSQRDEVFAIERDQHPPFGNGCCQLLFIGEAEAPCISHGETIDSVGPSLSTTGWNQAVRALRAPQFQHRCPHGGRSNKRARHRWRRDRRADNTRAILRV
jgi:hypothetical protein